MWGPGYIEQTHYLRVYMAHLRGKLEAVPASPELLLTEPGVGTDAAALQSTARREGDVYVLNGSKIWISLADLADHFLVFASVDRAKRHRGVTAFMVERGMKGLTTGTLHGKLGIRAGNTGLITMDNLEVPAENRIGEEGEGFLVAMSAIDQGRYTVAAGAVGLAQACLDASVRYAHERETFGEEIGRHQLVKQMIANMAKGTEVGRLLVWRAGWLKNHGFHVRGHVLVWPGWNNLPNAIRAYRIRAIQLELDESREAQLRQKADHLAQTEAALHFLAPAMLT